MTLIEGIGDEVTHFFIIVLFVIVGCLAWWTTNISEQRHVRTVFLLERRRTRHRLTNHTEAVTITEGNMDNSETVLNQSAGADDEMEPVSIGATNRSEPTEIEAGTSSAISDSQEEEVEQGIIIQTMDGNCSELRNRKPTATTASSEARPTDTEQNLMEHNYADRQNSKEECNERPTSEENEGAAGQKKRKENSINIKLKYINDELKLVDGCLQEQLGDFKKRHFQVELSSNKLIRLIFNGQVLQPDTLTLQNCGLFDNCVVHCLIHQRRQPAADEGGSENQSGFYTTSNMNRTPQANNNQAREWDLGSFLFTLISSVLASAWYFRYVYAHLYTVTATVGLIMLTGIFTIVLIGTYYPDQEADYTPPQQTQVSQTGPQQPQRQQI